MDPLQPEPSSSSLLLRDISNFKTPRRPSQYKPDASNRFNLQSPNPQYFTALKQTPRTAASSSLRTPARSAATACRLKAFEAEQSRTSRKAQLQKQRSLRTLSKSLTAWLNFLFENPRSCGCDLLPGQGGGVEPSRKGKRDSGPAQGVGLEITWRSPKRQKVPEAGRNGRGRAAGFSSSAFVKLRDSLKEVCSFDDLAERMRVYLSLDCCREIFNVTTQVTKNIDDGRLKMKAHCPLVTDYGMKEKAMRTLFSYNPVWLRIGLYIILGGDSLLTDRDVGTDQDIVFLKMVVEKQFLSHAGLAKSYAYNKKVEGMYRPGYYECLGNVILKRFLLLVLVLDRIKSRSSLSIKYGIDGLDGGSPLLFTAGSSIKSSSQMVNDFLSSDVMHGEGNLIAHLVIVGFKVSHHQSPLVEYDFKLVDVLEDLQDGIRLCRAIQLLKQDPSILSKLMVPSDTNKRNLANCSTALQYLKQFGVPLCDEDNMVIVADDIADRDKELTLSLLWNMFVQLQLPLLVDSKILADEVNRISGVTVDQSPNTSFSPLDMLLHWIRAICDNYELKIENLYSLTDGKAIWCLLDYYFRKELYCSCAPKGTKGEESIVSASDYPDAVHNFVLSQRLTTLLGDFPEVLETGDILEHHGACNGRSVVILLTFLVSQLVMKKNMDKLNFHKLLDCTCQTTGRRFSSHDQSSSSPIKPLNLGDTDQKRNEEAARKFKEIQAWWQKMADGDFISISKPNRSTSDGLSSSHRSIEIRNELAARVIQSHYRGYRERDKFLKMRAAVLVLQNAIQVSLLVSQKTIARRSLENRAALKILVAWKNFVSQKSLKVRHFAAINIQRHLRGWLMRKTYLIEKKAAIMIQTNLRCLKSRQLLQEAKVAARSAILIQSYVRRWIIRRSFLTVRYLVVRIQSHIRGWLRRKEFLLQKKAAILQKKAAITLQSWIRQIMLSTLFQNRRLAAIKIQELAARVIQSHYLGYRERDKFLKMRAAVLVLQNAIQVFLLVRQKTIARRSLENRAALKILVAWKNFVSQKSLKVRHLAAINIQRHLRGWLMRKTYLIEQKAAIMIQTNLRCLKSRQLLQEAKVAARSAILIQSYVRRWIIRRSFLTVRYLVVRIQSHIRGWSRRKEFLLQKKAAITLQSWIRQIMLSTLFQNRRLAAIKIQQFARGHISKKKLLGASVTSSSRNSSCSIDAEEIQMMVPYVVKLQRWWRTILLLRLQSAVIIQSYARRWFARQEAGRERQRVVVIQSYWKGYLARKEARGRIADLRLRVQKTAANVDDSMRLINRLTTALSELLNLRSVSSILHTCATLDMATRHSQKCCEKLVEVGAIDKLLKLICSMSRSIPDQEILKYALSTLRNLARYPHLVEVLISSQGSIETIFREMLRNKEDGYYIASELLKQICLNRRGVEAVRKIPTLVKRLHSLVEELTRKTDIEKRNARSTAMRENTDRRLKEATELLKLMKV